MGIAINLGSLDAGRLTSTFDAVCSGCGHYTNMPAGGRDAVSSSWKDAILSRRNGHGGGPGVVVANGVLHAEGENAVAVGDQIGLPANSDGLRITYSGLQEKRPLALFKKAAQEWDRFRCARRTRLKYREKI